MGFYPPDGATYYDKDTGRIEKVVYDTVDRIMDGAPPNCGIVYGQMIEFMTHYINTLTGQPELLPELPTFELVNGSISFDAAPPGTAIRVRNEAGEHIDFDASEGPLELSDPGSYTILIRPPFPWLDRSMEVTVP